MSQEPDEVLPTQDHGVAKNPASEESTASKGMTKYWEDDSPYKSGVAPAHPPKTLVEGAEIARGHGDQEDHADRRRPFHELIHLEPSHYRRFDR
mmetsp:Transcript_88650/g.275380  ORF Transcript_88650/g.275380 Transcript_88650/m.275380 type:complete len:94 (+) Transcript_88650:31-312(+)